MDQISDRYRGHIDGGGGVRREQTVILKCVRLMCGEDVLTIVAENNGRPPVTGRVSDEVSDFTRQNWLEAKPEAWGLPSSWRGMERLTARIRCGEKAVTVEFTVVGARGRLTSRKGMAAGGVETFSVDLIDLPLAQGRMPEFEPTGIRIGLLWEGAREERSVTIESVELIPNPTGMTRPCVDAFGQRVNGVWPGKIRRESDLVESLAREKAVLSGWSGPSGRSRYGGWTGGRRFEALGYFGVARDADGRWWLVDPDGHLFWSFGVTCVRPGDETVVDGREFLFEELPDREGRYASVYGRYVPLRGREDVERATVSLNQLNILKRHGTLEAWRDHCVDRMRRWGYNTIANWSHPLMHNQRLMPFVTNVSTRVGPLACHVWEGFFDVWDERWAAAFRQSCESVAAQYRSNPWLIGYFVDNELPWRDMRLLDAAASASVRGRWLDHVRGRYATLKELGEAFGRPVGDWDEVRMWRHEDLDAGPAGVALRKSFYDGYVERYFREVRRWLKAADPNHLYLGCRFVRVMPAESVVEAAGRQVDVMTVNCYSLLPDPVAFETWHRVGGRPILIGEHQLSLISERQPPQLWTCFTARERRRFYAMFEETFARMPFSVGSHWFQWADQMPTGRPSNGENQVIGVVDVTDQPHAEMVEAVREIGENMYRWHMEGRPR